MRALISSLIIFASGIVHAADESGMISITGAGNSTCGQWLDSVEKGDAREDIYTHWVLGFVAGRNAHAPGNVNVRNFDDARHFGRKHCRERPMDKVWRVGEALVSQADVDIGPPKRGALKKR